MQAFVDFPSAYTSQKVERALKTKLPSCQVVHKVEDFDTVSSSKQLQCVPSSLPILCFLLFIHCVLQMV